MLDLKIAGAAVLDGSGRPAQRQDVGVRDGRIVAVGDLRGESAAEVLEGEGHMLAPGFIDIHAHDDFNLPVNPAAFGKIMQGVTTVVNGNCGMSPAPLSAERLQEGIDLCMNQDSGLSWDWKSMGEYLDAIPGMGVNVCQLVGHSAVRVAALGNEDRAPSGAELDAMRTLVEESMAAGCYGMSTGLAMNPGSYAELPELIELSKVVARFGGSYHTHMRNEGNKVLEAIDEALAIGEGSGAAVQISHLKITNLDYWGHAEEMLARINAARARGQRVHADQYPYLASSGGLRSRLPRWATAGTKDEVLKRLQDPETRARVRYDVSEGMEKEGVSMRIYRWEKVLVATSSSRPDLVGLNLSEVAEKEGKAAVDALLDLLISDELTTRGIYFHIGDEDLQRIMRDPNVSVGSDGIFYGVPGKQDTTRVHPRHFGSFARVLGRYTREQRVLDLPEAIRKMTSLNADILGLKDRGRVAEGAIADLVLLNAETVLDNATFTEPHSTPDGVAQVFVAGTAVVRDGVATGNTPGRVLRKGQD